MDRIFLKFATGNAATASTGFWHHYIAGINSGISICFPLSCLCESLTSENSSRLAAIQRADKNIDELLIDLHGRFHRLRQSGIDEESFDVIAGFEALSVEMK